MSNFRQPILIAPRLSKTATPIDDLFKRFSRYGSELNKQTNGNVPKLIILGDIRGFSDSGLYDFVDYFFIGKNVFFQSLKIIHILKDFSAKRYSLIAGDIWFGAIITLIVRLLFFPKSIVQMSVHGIPSFGSKRILSTIKKILLKFLLQNSDGIRVVSKGLKDYLVQNFSIKTRNIFISPIPIAIPQTIPAEDKAIDIAIVGRLQSERNITEALEILQPFVSDSFNRSIHFFGNGPDAGLVEKWRDSTSSPSVIMHGQVSNSVVLRNLINTRMLLSCAPEEGYGLSLREALVAGVLVIARKNFGTIELKKLFSTNVFLYTDLGEAQEIILRIFNENLRFANWQEIRQTQEMLDKNSIEVLIHSWIF